VIKLVITFITRGFGGFVGLATTNEGTSGISEGQGEENRMRASLLI
jgi:hypothetical protein